MTKFCPPLLCNVPPIIRHRVYGSGRLFQPWPMAAQAPGYAYIYGDQNPANPMPPCPPCDPSGMVPRAPDGYGTSVVGAGILSPVRWRGNGIMADNYALPGDIAREPNEGWWASETVDADTGQRSWITGMSGLGEPRTTNWTGGRAGWALTGNMLKRHVLGLGALTLPSWFNNTFISIGGIRIPNWLGYGVLAFAAYKIAKKRGWVKNAGRRGRRRNASGTLDKHAAEELALFIENDGDLHRQMHQPILKNLATKVARGQYNHALAVKGFMYLVDEGAKRYCGESRWVRTGKGNCSMPWHVMFNTATRRDVAEQFVKSFETENALGNYKHLLPKKYQKNSRRSRR